jgi:hypothetical protein
MIGFLARLALGGLMKIGVGEALAGRLTASRLFAPVALTVVSAAAVAAVLGVLALHDGRVARQASAGAVHQCNADKLESALKAAELQLALERRARREADDQLRDREIALAAAEIVSKQKESENAELRRAASDPDGLALPDDEWLRGRGAAAGRARPAPRR